MSSRGPVFQFLGTDWRARSCVVSMLCAGLVLSIFFGSLPELRAQGEQQLRDAGQLETLLENSVGVSWQGKPLRGALESLSESQGIGIFLDRRIDPGQELNFVADPMPLEELLTRLTAQLRLGYCRVGEVIYIGPVATAEVLETVAALRRQEEESLPNERRRELTRQAESGWGELSQPRDLLAETAAAAGVSWDEEQRLPHDLWPAVTLPRLRMADRATLILAGFGLTYALDEGGTVLAVQPLPTEAVIELEYSRGNHGANVIAQLSEAFPESTIRAAGERIAVTGRMQDQRLIRRLLAGEQVRRREVEAAELEYTLRVEQQPVGSLMRALAQRLGKQVEFDASLNDLLEERVSFEVEKVDLPGLLEAALAPAGLRAEIEGDTIHVLPAGG